MFCLFFMCSVWMNDKVSIDIDIVLCILLIVYGLMTYMKFYPLAVNRSFIQF